MRRFPLEASTVPRLKLQPSPSSFRPRFLPSRHGFRCEGEKLVDGVTIPLVLQPRDDDHPSSNKGDVESLLEGLKNNKHEFDQLIKKHGAVLVRGFDVKNAVDFNEVVEVFGWEEAKYVGRGTRTNIHKRIWTANEGPLSTSLRFHHEMVLFSESINKVILFCDIPPPQGGQTPFVPSFRVAERMAGEFPEIVDEMERKGLVYTFTAAGKNDASTMVGRSWEDMLGTSVRAEAEKKVELMGMEFEWLLDGGMKLIMGPKPLTKVFEGRLGRRMWFNSINAIGKDRMYATMADGTEIPPDVVKRCEEIMEEESVEFRWEKGDILFLDNKSMLHGKRPSLPPRRVLTALCK